MEIFAIENLTFFYPETKTPAISDFSLTVNAGDFFVLCGQSGCGKSTLLRQLKPQLAPHGVKSGKILFAGTPVEQLGERDSAAKIGFVLQSPENQIVTDKVWHELAFGLESLGYDTPTIRRRVAEMASFFGIQNWFYKDVTELSGGQKQLLNLASVMVMQPKILILDEPTSQLDPIAASDFLATLKKINRELGTTILLTEHRLEEALSLATRAAVMDKGRLLCQGTVEEIGVFLKESRHEMFLAMPAAMRVWGSVESGLPCPVSVKDGSAFLSAFTNGKTLKPLPPPEPGCVREEMAVSIEDAWFRYEKELPDVVRGVSLTAKAGELLCILGGNGTGKTTTLKLLAGYHKPYRGRVHTQGRVCFLPQNPQTLFVKKTVFADLLEALAEEKLPKAQKEEKILEILRLCRLTGLEDRHPYDLSGGEQQRAALAKLLLLHPDVLLLDEPTKGLDAGFKLELAEILQELLAAGVCIVMVSHDIEFCARYADRCALFFDGGIVTEGAPRAFFAGNSFYTTSANRMAREIAPEAVTTQDVIKVIGGRAGKVPVRQAASYQRKSEEKKPEPQKKLPRWRKILGAVLGISAAAVFFYGLKTEDLKVMVDIHGVTGVGQNQLLVYGLLILLLFATAICIGRRAAPPVQVQTPSEKRKLSKRTLLAVGLILLIAPLTLFVGVFYLGRRQYYLTALAILVECMLPFFLIFEGRRPKARELVIIAVLCALNVAGRAAFFMLPQFKPVLALTIIAGVAFGGETGFLVGAVTMLVSNILFSQGPWTPWQMFAAGIIGFLAGVLYRKGWLRRTRASLCAFGAISAVVIYGGIMNPSSALIWGSESLNWNMILGYYITGFLMDCVHGAATAFFLFCIAEPMLEKLDRIKVKYGLVE